MYRKAIPILDGSSNPDGERWICTSWVVADEPSTRGREDSIVLEQREQPWRRVQRSAAPYVLHQPRQ